MSQTSCMRPVMYGLSTCGWCAKARDWLDRHVGQYDLIYVDLLEHAERHRVMGELSKRAGSVAFPLVFFGEECVVGFKPDEYARLVKR